MIRYVDLQFWLMAFMLIMAYSSVSVLLSASAPVRTWLYGSVEPIQLPTYPRTKGQWSFGILPSTTSKI